MERTTQRRRLNEEAYAEGPVRLILFAVLATACVAPRSEPPLEGASVPDPGETEEARAREEALRGYQEAVDEAHVEYVRTAGEFLDARKANLEPEMDAYVKSVERYAHDTSDAAIAEGYTEQLAAIIQLRSDVLDARSDIRQFGVDEVRTKQLEDTSHELVTLCSLVRYAIGFEALEFERVPPEWRVEPEDVDRLEARARAGWDEYQARKREHRDAEQKLERGPASSSHCSASLE